MAASPTLYQILKVDPTAPYMVIQAAYRALARTFHPDHGGDAEVMARLNEAWEVLGDLRRREAYDLALRAATRPDPVVVAGPPAGAPRAWSPAPVVEDVAGPPPGHPSGPVMSYGRYKGWSLGEVARHDRRFLEWLRSVPAGMALRHHIDAALHQAGAGLGIGGRPVVRDLRPETRTSAHERPWSLGARFAAQG